MQDSWLHRQPLASYQLNTVITILALLGVIACSDQLVEPDAGAGEPPADATDPPDPRSTSPSSLVADGAWIIDPNETPLVSTEVQLAVGEYRFRDTTGIVASIQRDDVILPLVRGEWVPRRVLNVEKEDDVAVLDTGPARWSDVINSGRFGLTATIASGAAETLAGEQLSFAEGMELPPTGGPFELDFCAVVDSIAAIDPALNDVQLCDNEQSISQTVAGVRITLAGSLDSLAIMDGNIEVTGNTSIEMLIDGGGVVGGEPPVFAPCHVRSYPGCLRTPTGAEFIDWLRRHAPSVPEESLRPVRVCVPGTKIRVRSGRWEGLRWIPPEFETCRIADIGELPTVVLPSIQHVTAIVQPRLKGGMTLYAQADGRLGIRIPIPKLGFQRKQSSGGISAELKAGFFVDVGLTVKNTSGWARAELDEEIRVTQIWTPEGGWDSETESIRSRQSFDYGFDNPDSLVVKTFLPIVSVGLSMTVNSGSDLSVTASEGFEFGPFAEATYTRKQIDPEDPAIDNWHLADEQAYELRPSAGIELPDGFEPPNVPTSWSPTFEFGRVHTGDTWGLANLIVETATTGASIDTDGYTVVVTRSDTLPVVIHEGAVRDGEANDHGTPMERAIGATETVVFERPRVACSVAYTDASGGVWKSAVRKAGFDVPNNALVSRDCNLLVARHTVELAGIAANCTVDGGAERDSVWLLQRRFGVDARDDTTRVVFDVECGNAVPMGAISVTANVPSDAGGPFELRLDGAAAGLIAAGETKLLSGLAAGDGRTLEFLGLADHCTSSPESVDIVAGETTDVTLDGQCGVKNPDPGTVTATLMHTGPLPDGVFAMVLDGEPRAGVPAGGEAIAGGLMANTPSMLLISSIPPQCRVVSTNPLVVDPDADLTPIAVDFETECTAAVIDTVQGTVAVTAYPVPSASVDAADGSGSSRLTGPLAEDFLQLAGTSVRVRGVRAGTSFEVYGYEILSSLAEPQWIGIVAERDDTLWLFGEEAIELVEPPPALEARVGALVWVGGDEIGVLPTRVVPRLYGVIREAAP